MKKLEYIEFGIPCYFDTGLYADPDTEVETWFSVVSFNQNWNCFFGAQQMDDSQDTYQVRRYSNTNRFSVRICDSDPTVTNTFTLGEMYHILFNKTGFTVNDVLWATMSPTTNYTTYYTMYVGAVHNDTGAFRPTASKWGEFIVRQSGVVVGDFIPVLDENDEPCFYDNVSQTYKYNLGSGDFIPGPVATTIWTEPSSISFDYTGGSESVMVYSTDGNWEANTQNLPSWLTVSPTTGANGDSLTISAAPITSSGQQSRSGFFNISNQEDAAQITYSQKGTGDLIFRNFIMFNDRGLNKEYLETHNIMKMFYNGREVFRRVSFIPTLSVDTNALTFRKTGGTETVGIASNTTWSASTSASWLTITTAATGISVTAADYSTGETERNATILVSASNGDFIVSETINVVQKVAPYTELAWISDSNDGLSWNHSNCIIIPIVLSQNSSIRLKYEEKSVGTANNTDRLIGYTWQDTDIHGSPISDNADWRGFGSNYYDVGSSRRYISNNYSNYSDLTFGNVYVYNNVGQVYILSGSAQTIYTEAYCHVDMDCIKVKGVNIYDGNTEVFHGVPAMDGDGNIGLWDEVSDTLIYNPDLTMTYGEIE